MTSNRHPTDGHETLDRVIWSALTSKQQSLALGNDLARRYPPMIAPFAAVSAFTPEAIDELGKLAAAGPVAIKSKEALGPLANLKVQRTAVLRQMVSAADAGPSDLVPETLSAQDVPEMLELTTLTRPGPFGAETYRLGRYIGIRDNGRLVAMAGERMRLDGFTEISAVCVHPDYRGRGYAQRLVRKMIELIRADDDVPFLHVLDENRGAIALYERLGFRTRESFQLTVLSPARDE